MERIIQCGMNKCMQAMYCSYCYVIINNNMEKKLDIVIY